MIELLPGEAIGVLESYVWTTTPVSPDLGHYQIWEMMPMSKLRYTFKTDTLFKMLFVKHKDLLKKLVAALLGIKVENIRQFVVRNEEMPPEVLGDKFCRLDINMVVNGQLVDLEIQVANGDDYPERVMLYMKVCVLAGERTPSSNHCPGRSGQDRIPFSLCR